MKELARLARNAQRLTTLYPTFAARLKRVIDLLDDNAPLKPSTAYILQLAAAAETEGLATGIRWDLPANLVKGIDPAIAAKDWKAAVKIGWDPLHAESTGITVAQAKAGKRPT